LIGSIEDFTFVEVVLDEPNATLVPVDGGCETSITSLSFVAAIE
jgi:hypothetical protein